VGGAADCHVEVFGFGHRVDVEVGAAGYSLEGGIGGGVNEFTRGVIIYVIDFRLLGPMLNFC
jgi:hypothetical protein